MKLHLLKYAIAIVTFFVSFIVKAQDYSALWQGHFSFNEIKAVAQGSNVVFAASENAVFKYNTLTREIETITTVQGLSGETITTITYSEVYRLLFIGYENGLIEIILDPDNEIRTVVDIVEKTSISPILKRINHFYEREGFIYISTNFGISVFNLERLEFGDTYFIGDGGAPLQVNQVAIFNQKIYAACSNNGGVRFADIESSDLIDYQEWTAITRGNYEAIQQGGNNLYTIRSSKHTYAINGTTLSLVHTFSDLPTDNRGLGDKLIITTAKSVLIFDANFNLSKEFFGSDYETSFSAATVLGNSLYIGTKDLGVLEIALEGVSEPNFVLPDGPLFNTPFKLQTAPNELWVTYGGYTQFYRPQARKQGVSHLTTDGWSNIPFDSLLTAKGLCDIAVNPFDNTQVFISSFSDGLLELKNNKAIKLYNQTNSGLESLIIPGNPSVVSIRVGSSTFDKEGLLWTMTSLVDKALKSYNPSTGQWQGYSFSGLISNALKDELGFADLVIDANGTKWTGGLRKGVIAYNENGQKIKNIFYEEQNLPSPAVWSLALDGRGTLWIGTIRGLRVLYNTSEFFNNPNPRVNEIVIVEDGIPQELLGGEYITDIKVDGSDNKWIGTSTSGVFYISPDGQETIYHFTKANSPIPSNAITDIALDSATGRVYIGTSKGLVSFLTGGTTANDKLDGAYVYPNPVRPEYNLLGDTDLNNINKGVKIRGLTENVNIKITDIEGNLVAEAQSRINKRSDANTNFAIDGGTAIWNGRNLANNIVATGVYLIMISDLDTFETKVLKVLVVR